MLVLFNSSSEINSIYPTFARELGFFIGLTEVRAQKIDGIMLVIYGIVVVAFLVTDKIN